MRLRLSHRAGAASPARRASVTKVWLTLTYAAAPAPETSSASLHGRGNT